MSCNRSGAVQLWDSRSGESLGPPLDLQQKELTAVKEELEASKEAQQDAAAAQNRLAAAQEDANHLARAKIYMEARNIPEHGRTGSAERSAGLALACQRAGVGGAILSAGHEAGRKYYARLVAYEEEQGRLWEETLSGEGPPS